MPQFAMPFLILNYGGEMIYILEQRLIAQKIAADKCIKVLGDVVSAMFAESFITELMRPQEIYTPEATREIFMVLAHTSIMRLSEQSMGKLYDLMTMGCKQQLLVARTPYDMVELTQNHLSGIQSALRNSPAVSTAIQRISSAASQLDALATSLTIGELAEIRMALLNFFQGNRIKVSLYLKQHLQLPDGTLLVPRGNGLPRHVAPPVAFLHFEKRGKENAGNEKEGGDGGRNGKEVEKGVQGDTPQRTCPFQAPVSYSAGFEPFGYGYNIYLSDGKGKEEQQNVNKENEKGVKGKEAGEVKSAVGKVDPVKAVSATQSLGALKKMIAVPTQTKAVPLSFLVAKEKEKQAGETPILDKEGKENEVIEITCEEEEERILLSRVREEMDVGGDEGNDGGDLLDLMDSA